MKMTVKKGFVLIYGDMMLEGEIRLVISKSPDAVIEIDNDIDLISPAEAGAYFERYSLAHVSEAVNGRLDREFRIGAPVIVREGESMKIVTFNGWLEK